MTDMSIYRRPARENLSLVTYDIKGATSQPKIRELELVNRSPKRYGAYGLNQYGTAAPGGAEPLPDAYELEKDLKLSQEYTQSLKVVMILLP